MISIYSLSPKDKEAYKKVKRRSFSANETIKLKFNNYSEAQKEKEKTDLKKIEQFIEDNASLCSSEEILHCILVRKNFCQSGVLVVPESTCYVGWAAYVNTNT